MRKMRKLLCIAMSALMVAGVCNAMNAPVQVRAEETIQKELPANPVYDETTDSTEWDYVYFGTYPQTEVTGEDLTDAVMNAAYDTNGYATVDGVTYKRLYKEDTTYKRNTIDANYDEYMQLTERISAEFYDWYDKEYAYFRVEPIRWKVLQNDGDALLLMADKALDTQKYNKDQGNSSVGTYWATCTLRTEWLNSTFLDAAFDDAQQAAILDTEVVTNDNPFFGTEGGDNTVDKIFLMSNDEMTNTAYGFNSDFSAYSKTRRVAPTDYAQAMGAWMGAYNDQYYGNCWYLLRSTGAYTSNVCTVYPFGYVYQDGYLVNRNYYAICPALRVSVDSDAWTMADEAEAAARNAELAEGKAAEKPALKEVIFGDLNGDEDVTVADARIALRAGLKIDNLSSTMTQMAADVDGSGSITTMDAQLILQRSLHLITYFPQVEFDPSPLVQTEYEPTGTLWVAADSIADVHSDKSSYIRPIYGWEEVIEGYLTTGTRLQKTAKSSRSTKEFMNHPNNYGKIMSGMKAGDYLIISFGHNDEHPDIEYYSDPFGDSSEVGTYKWFLKNYYIDPAIRAGVQPVLVTPVVRRYFYEGELLNPQLHSPYAQAMKELAAEYAQQGINVYLIDLHSRFMELYEELGETGTEEYHGLADWGSGPVFDNTHLSLKGATQATEWILEEMKAQNMSYAKFIKED